MEVGAARVLEDRTRVECDDVDAAHLLCNHNGEGGQGCSSNSWDCEELDETSNVVAVPDDFPFDFKLAVDIVQVSGCLKGAVSQLQERSIGLWIAVLF